MFENYYYGGLLRFDMAPKPAFIKLNELLKQRWHTEEKIVTDENGIVNFRGFYGSYDIEIILNGKNVAKKINLSKKSDNVFAVVI